MMSDYHHLFTVRYLSLKIILCLKERQKKAKYEATWNIRDDLNFFIFHQLKKLCTYIDGNILKANVI